MASNGNGNGLQAMAMQKEVRQGAEEGEDLEVLLIPVVGFIF